MSRVTQILRQRQHRRPALFISRTGLGCSTALSLVMALLGLGLVFAAFSVTRKLPSLDNLPILADPSTGPIYQPTRIYDRSGEHVLITLENPASAGRQFLSVDEKATQHLPQVLVQAILASSDPSFWENPGFTLAGLGQGIHPTLAQKLVYELLLRNEPAGIRRNLRERLLAAQLTWRYGREKVLEWYLNTAKFGHLIYGADAASRAYFGKPATNLSLAESAWLAAAAETPDITLLTDSNTVQDRENQILQIMGENDWISQAESSTAKQAQLSLHPLVPPEDQVPAFTNLVLEQLSRYIPREEIERGGWRIFTTLDNDLQLEAECATATQVARLARKTEAVTTREGQPCQAARLLPTLSSDESEGFPDLSASAVLLDPRTGQILALVGEPISGFDPAHLSDRPVGTLFTPLIYLTAFTRGLSPASLLWDVPGNLPPDQAGLTGWEIEYQGPLRLRTALANDYLGPAAQLIGQLGTESVLHTAEQLGLVPLPLTSSGQAQNRLSLLDYPGTSLLEFSQAFGIFANQGVLAGQVVQTIQTPPATTGISPSAVLRVEDVNRQIFLDWSTPQARSVLSPQLAYLMNHVLSDEPARWPSLGHPNPLEIGRPAAAKIGVTRTKADSWVIGYTPQRVAGVWIGTRSTAQGTVPATAAAELWHAILQYASQNLPSQSWRAPTGVSTVEVCDPSGLLPTTSCPAVVSEVFLDGNEPVHADNLYRVLQINRETGRLATVFTPPELVEERVYLMVPPEAVEWAAKAGLPTPPDTYDVIYAPPAPSPETAITAPQMFAHVSGRVTLVGTATGKDFSSYRIQVGQGLNPKQWIQIGQDVSSPVKNGTLGTWDTQGLSGLYAIQLLVVRQDQRVDHMVIQVTIDNQPPVVSVLNPVDGQEIKFASGSAVILQANASDDLELARVEFWIDDQQVATLPQAPYYISWPAKLGTHTLRVQAVDLAGNASEAKLQFSVEK